MKKITIIIVSNLFLASSVVFGIKTQDVKLSRVAAVCLWAENVPETAEFYQKLLGLEVSSLGQKDRTRLRLDGAVLFILKGEPCSAKSNDPFPLFALTIDDLDKSLSFIKDRKLKIPYGIQGSGRHRELQFYDPTGNLVELVQNR